MGRLEFDPSWVVIRVLMLLRLARLVGERVKLAA
jgi:fatty-acid desaturase